MFKSKDFSLPGAILIVISQVFSSFQSSDQISKEIEKFRDDFQQSLVDREKYFVRKTELSEMFSKIDRLNVQMIKMNEQIKTLKSQYQSFLDDVGGNETIISCSLDSQKGFI